MRKVFLWHLDLLAAVKTLDHNGWTKKIEQPKTSYNNNNNNGPNFAYKEKQLQTSNLERTKYFLILSLTSTKIT